MLLPLLAGVVGFAAGLLGGVVAGGSRTAPPQPLNADLASVIRELQELRAHLHQLATPSQAAPMHRGEAAVRQQPSLDAERLTDAVTDLVRVVEALAQRADVLSVQRAGGAGVLAQVANRAGSDVAGLVAVARAGRADHTALQADWMFVPATEILRRFGRPTGIGGGKGGGMQWQYEFEADGDSYWVGFTIVDGYVARVD